MFNFPVIIKSFREVNLMPGVFFVALYEQKLLCNMAKIIKTETICSS